MATELPKIAGPGDRRGRRRRDHDPPAVSPSVVDASRAWSSVRSISASEKPVSVTSKSRSIKRLQLDRQDLAVPAGVERELVVGQHIGASLLGAEMRQPQRRHGRNAEFLGCHHPAVAGDDLALVADQHRVGEAEALDAVGDLTDLLPRMAPRIARIGSQRVHRQHLDLWAWLRHEKLLARLR